jgi:anti-sigma regulatory factor (Ser/Thr protein kinase)
MLHRIDGGVQADLVDTLRLLVSELVTNAVTYGPDGEVAVKVVVAGGLIRVEVMDEGTGGVTPRTPTRDDDHGRGLMLVDALADRWGSDDGRSTVVWIELDAGV